MGGMFDLQLCRLNPYKNFLLLFVTFFLQSCESIQPSQSQIEPAAHETNLTTTVKQQADIQILVFSKTTGFRHNSIEPAIEMLQSAAAENNWGLSKTEDADQFSDSNLANFEVVVWLSTTGDVLNDDQQAAFERFVQAGGGFAGIHAATDTEYDWEWYNGLVGAHFAGHPPIQTADILLANASHPSTRFFPCRWSIRDEWYNFQTNPADNEATTVLLWLDESTYTGGTMGDQHPIAWAREYDGGRSWYTAAGHRSELYTDTEYDLFQRHVLAGIEWAAGLEKASKSSLVYLNLTPTAYLPAISTTGDCTP